MITLHSHDSININRSSSFFIVFYYTLGMLWASPISFIYVLSWIAWNHIGYSILIEYCRGRRYIHLFLHRMYSMNTLECLQFFVEFLNLNLSCIALIQGNIIVICSLKRFECYFWTVFGRINIFTCFRNVTRDESIFHLNCCEERNLIKCIRYNLRDSYQSVHLLYHQALRHSLTRFNHVW